MSTRLGSYILRRLATFVPVIIVVTVLVFLMLRFTPGDPIAIMFGESAANLTPEQYAALQAKLGLDKPLHIQYYKFLEGLVQGNLGYSLRWSSPVTALLKKFFLATFELTIVGLFVSLGVGIPLGIISAVNRNRFSDHIVRIFSLGGIAAPVFWLGIILQLLFYSAWGLLPGGGRMAAEVIVKFPLKRVTGLMILDSILTLNWNAFKSTVAHIILPAVALSYRAMALITRMTRSAMLEVLDQDFIKTSKAYGLKQIIIIIKYAFKNALIPILTVVGLAYGQLMQGTWLIESIFNWPGMGLWASQAIILSDYASIMGVSLVAILTYLLVNLLVDVLYTFVDPRIKY